MPSQRMPHRQTKCHEYIPEVSPYITRGKMSQQLYQTISQLATTNHDKLRRRLIPTLKVERNVDPYVQALTMKFDYYKFSSMHIYINFQECSTERKKIHVHVLLLN